MAKKAEIDYFEIEGFTPDALGLHPPPLRTAEECFWQLTYLARSARELGARSVAVERHYIDRDYIEDHSAFYAKSLHQYKNACQRVHFFRVPRAELEAKLRTIAAIARDAGDFQKYRDACRTFSKEFYLGFCVVKPLDGSPVGRTVLAAPSKAIVCARRYDAHLLGVELSVHGVPFQQQDVGVSACATTALWSSLRVLSALESITHATPVQITKLASQSYLPLGRSMPQSEGLNVGQMCQAVEALGVAPLLFRPSGAEDARGFLYSVLLSRIAPVLLITEDTAKRGRTPESHAVTVVGYELSADARNRLLENSSLADPAQGITAVYLHDDRIGPYLRAVLDVSASGELLVHIPGGTPDPEAWRLNKVLVPIHAKVRLSFAGLRAVGGELAGQASRCINAQTNMFPGAGDPPVCFETWFWRTHKYVEDLLRRTKAPVEAVLRFSSDLALPRYLGVIRLSSDCLEHAIDILIDTTSTPENLHVLAVVPLGPTGGGLSTAVAVALSEFLTRDDEVVPLIA